MKRILKILIINLFINLFLHLTLVRVKLNSNYLNLCGCKSQFNLISYLIYNDSSYRNIIFN